MKAFLDALYGYALEQGIAPYLETREYHQTICAGGRLGCLTLRAAGGTEPEPGRPPGPGEEGRISGGRGHFLLRPLHGLGAGAAIESRIVPPGDQAPRSSAIRAGMSSAL